MYWDLQDKYSVSNIGITIQTSKQPWEILFTKTNLPSFTQLFSKSNASSVQLFPEVVSVQIKRRDKALLQFFFSVPILIISSETGGKLVVLVCKLVVLLSEFFFVNNKELNYLFANWCMWWGGVRQIPPPRIRLCLIIIRNVNLHLTVSLFFIFQFEVVI